VYTLAYARDGQTLASGDTGGFVKLWDLTSGQVRLTLPRQGGDVLALAFAPDGKTLASSVLHKQPNQDGVKVWGEVKLWDPYTGRKRALVWKSPRYIWALAFAPDGQTLALASIDHTIRLWDLAGGECRATLRGHTGAVLTLAYSPDGKWLASGGADKTIRLWDPGTGKWKATLKGSTGAVRGVAFAPRGNLLAGVGLDGKVRLWDRISGKMQGCWSGHSWAINRVAFSPDGRSLATGAGAIVDGQSFGELIFWDWRQGRLRLRARYYDHTSIISALAFSPDGKWLATASWDKTIKLWTR
jgi:WD40 repeat protein